MGLAEIKIPEELLKELERIAKKTSKTRDYHIKKALRLYLEEYRDPSTPLRAGLEIALERSKNKKDRIITSEQLKKSLGV
jgi:metal-responsive CopG/Arc/MetJ family transcriptional regulator